MKLTGSQKLLLRDLGIPRWQRRAVNVVDARPAQAESESEQEVITASAEEAAETVHANANTIAAETAPANTVSPEADSAEPVSADTAPAEQVQPVQPIHFAWTRLHQALILHPVVADKSQTLFLRDILAAAAWSAAQAPTGAGKFVAGEFRWPQLENSTGSPERALSVWFNKQLEGVDWLGIDAAVASQHANWPDSTEKLVVVKLGDTLGAMSQAQGKQELWRWIAG